MMGGKILGNSQFQKTPNFFEVQFTPCTQNFLELRLVHVLIDFLGLSMFINAFLPEIYSLMK